MVLGSAFSFLFLDIFYIVAAAASFIIFFGVEEKKKKKIRGRKKNGNLRRLFNEICLIHLVNRIKNEENFSFVLHNGLKWMEMAGLAHFDFLFC